MFLKDQHNYFIPVYADQKKEMQKHLQNKLHNCKEYYTIQNDRLLHPRIDRHKLAVSQHNVLTLI